MLGRYPAEADFHPSSHSKYARYGHESDEFFFAARAQIAELDGDPMDLKHRGPLGFRMKSKFPFEVSQEVVDKHQAPSLDILLRSFGRVVDYSPYFTGQFKEDVLEQYGLDKDTIDTMRPLSLTQDDDDHLFEFEPGESWFDPELTESTETISAAEAYSMTMTKNKEINSLLTNSASRSWYLDMLRKLQEMAISGVQNKQDAHMALEGQLVSFPSNGKIGREARRTSVGETRKPQKKRKIAERPSRQACNFDNFGD